MKTINPSLSPNTSRQDVWLALRLLAAPRRWEQGGAVTRALEQRLSGFLGGAEAFAVDSGRAALYLTLKALGIGPGDEVLLQAYTCIAVPNAVVWAGARPVYADIEPSTLNVDANDLEAKITPNTRAIIVQHTFGRPGPIREIVALARGRGLRVIEDCAHALGASLAGPPPAPAGVVQPLGSFGDAAIFSLGRDKVISSVSGGLIATRDPALAREIARRRDALPRPSPRWVFQQLFHPVALAGILPLYDTAQIGKAMLVGLQKAGLLDRAVRPEEQRGEQPAHLPARLPDAVAQMALNQFDRLEAFNAHRRKLAALYTARLAEAGVPLPAPDAPGAHNIYLRYTLHVPAPEKLHRTARAHNLYLGNWYDAPIAPRTADLAAVAYTPGQCPHAEQQAATSINLPTHPKVTLADAGQIADIVLQALRQFPV